MTIMSLKKQVLLKLHVDYRELHRISSNLMFSRKNTACDVFQNGTSMVLTSRDSRVSREDSGVTGRDSHLERNKTRGG